MSRPTIKKHSLKSIKFTFVYAVFLLLLISCQHQKKPKLTTIKNPFLKEMHQIDAIYASNQQSVRHLITNSSKMYEDYSKLVWIKENIHTIKTNTTRIELQYYKKKRQISKRIKAIKTPLTKNSSPSIGNLLGIGPFEKERSKVQSKITILSELFEIQNLLIIQMKTIAPILTEEYHVHNWSDFQNQEVKNQTKSYINRISELEEEYKNHKAIDNIVYEKAVN